jgi:predicted permease
MLNDLGFAVRQLRKSPGFALAVMVTLALGIGVNTAVFSMLDGFLLRRLPYPEPNRIAALELHEEGVSQRTGERTVEDDDSVDLKTWNAVHNDVTSVTAAAYGDQFGAGSGANLETPAEDGGAVRYVRSAHVSAHYFDVLGIKPAVGREFSEDEDRAGGPKAAVLSYALWMSLFRGDRSVAGRSITLKGEPYTVVGVLPKNVVMPNPVDIWTPVRASDPTGECGGNNCGVLMRLKPGATWEQVAAQLAHLPRPDYAGRKTRTWFYAQPLAGYVGSTMRSKVLVLMLAVSFILLIVCANLAGLALVRISRRTQEIATRLALGASRGAVLRQLWMENLLLALLGAAAGLMLAGVILRGLRQFLPEYMIPLGGFGIDARVLLFSIGAALVTSLLFGALPALVTRRVDLRSSIAVSSYSVVGGSGSVRKILIGAEVALTVVLLAAAGLLVRTLTHLETLPPGFDAHDVMTAKASLDDVRYKDAAAFRALLDKSVAAIRRIPGVEDVAVGLSVPYERGLNLPIRILDGKLSGTEAANDGSSVSYITPDYFSSLRIPLLAGRAIAEGDSSTSERVVVVNEGFARKFFHEANPVGTHFQMSWGQDKGTAMTVVGVVADVTKEPGMTVDAPLATEPVFYVPAAQVGDPLQWHIWFQPSWIVRTRGPVSGLTAAMERAMAEADPNLPFSGFYSMEDLMRQQLQMQRVEVLLLSTLAGLALLLSAIGIYALVSNLVVQRTREIGIRMALGSSIGQAVVEIGSSGVMAAVVGLVVGVALSFLALRVLRSELYGVGVYDPLTLLAAPSLLALIAVVASWLPALRISRIDPALTLRSE